MQVLLTFLLAPKKDTEKSGKCFDAAIHSLGFRKSLSVLGKNDIIEYRSETLKPRIRKC